MMIRKLLIAFALSVVGLSAAATQASAGFEMSITANGHEWCNAGNVCQSGTNTITGNAMVRGPNAGGQRVLVSATGTFSPTARGYQMGFSSLSMTHMNGSPADVTVALTYTDLTGPKRGSLGGLLNLTIHNSATVTISLYADGSDTAFGQGSGPLATITLTSSTTAQQLAGMFDVTGSALYSLTIVIEVQFAAGTNGSSVSLNYLPAAVPEPGSLALLGIGLLIVGLAFSRRRLTGSI